MLVTQRTLKINAQESEEFLLRAHGDALMALHSTGGAGEGVTRPQAAGVQLA